MYSFKVCLYYFIPGKLNASVQDEEKAIAQLENSIADMEAMLDRQRKDMGGYYIFFFHSS